MPRIELDNLSVTYLDKKHNEYSVLKNISGYFESGSINIINGASGTGKTTLLKAIAGQLDFDGAVRFDDKNISNPSLIRKENVAYIDQDNFLFQNKIVYDILAFPLKQQHIKSDELDQKVKNVADMLGISNLLTRKPKQLSLGQRQKVALGKALIKKPNICLFDEPFSNLDEESKTFCLSLIRNLARENGATIILVSHSEKDADVLGATIYSLNEDGLTRIKDAVNKNILDEISQDKIPLEQAKLPVNRKQLFGDILKNRYRILFLTGMMLFAFAIPFIAVALLNDLTLVSFFADSNNYTGGAITESGQSIYQSILTNFTFFYSTSFLVFSIGLAGASYIIRQLCWGEGIQFFHSFGKGMKQNIIRFLALTVIIDIIFIAARLLFIYVDALWAVVVVSVIGGFVFLPIIVFCFGYSTVYLNSFPKAFTNSVLLAIKHYPIALLLSVMFILPFITGFFPYGLSIIKTILLFIFMIVIIPILFLVGGLNLNSVFDKEINMDKHKEIYRKGLY